MIKKVKGAGKQYAVLGLGKFGQEISKALSLYGCEVLAVDIDEAATNSLAGIVTHTAVADVSDEAVLRSLDIDNFDVVVIAIGENIQASIVCAMCCKELGAKYVMAKARTDNHAKILEKIGVDKIIVPEADSAQRAAAMLLNPNVSEVIEMKNGYSIAEVRLPMSWEGKDIVELNIRAEYGVNVLFVVSSGNVYVPSGETQFVLNDKLVVGGLTDDMDKFLNRKLW